METKLSGLEFFKGSFFADCDKQPVLDSLQLAVEMDSDRLFVQIGVNDARSTVGLIMVLNELKIDCDMLAIDPLPRARFAWDSLCSGIRGSCTQYFQSSFSEAIAAISFYGPVWIFISGCPCYQCVKANLKNWAHRVLLDGFLLMHSASEGIEGSKIISPHHIEEGKEVRCGVLRAVESTSKVIDCYDTWHYMEEGLTKIWRRER